MTALSWHDKRHYYSDTTTPEGKKWIIVGKEI